MTRKVSLTESSVFLNFQVKSSIALILEEEEKLKRDVIKADPDGKQGPEPVRVTNANFSKLHKLPGYIDTIEKYSEKTFKEIANGSAVLFKDVVWRNEFHVTEGQFSHWMYLLNVYVCINAFFKISR